MQLAELKSIVDSHCGTFHCVQRGNDANRKDVKFIHVYAPPNTRDQLISIPRIAEFYETFGELLLYHDPVSKDAAFYISSIDEWASFKEQFTLWLSDLTEEERKELLPDWINSYIVIGEIPRSGNYLLVPTEGEHAGHIFEFEHDGFEFIELASSLEEFVKSALKPNNSQLRAMASHLTFIDGEDYSVQWWISEMEDNQGNVVSTTI